MIDAAVIGAGVVGLAVGRALALRGREVLVLEREAGVGRHASSRNSEVIHAGLYYPPGSWKARLCVEGRALLYDYLAARGVAHRRIGKLIVATSTAQLAALDDIFFNAANCGVGDLARLSADEARALEPELRCQGALWSPSTGILDSHGFLRALEADLEAAGGRVVLRAPVSRLSRETDGFTLAVGEETLRARAVVNAAGMFASDIEGVPHAPKTMLVRGHYFALAGRAPFQRLVYPLPEPGGLGVHFTLGLDGRARFGPDVEPIDRVDYGFDESRAAAFTLAVRDWFPALPDGALRPDTTGIRAKVAGDDFVIQDITLGLVCLYGIESPGLTAALALAEEVARRL